VISTQAELEAALLAGGDIVVDSGVTIDLTATMQVTQPSRIRGGRFTRDSGPAFEITSAGVDVDDVEITGGGAAAGYDPTQKLIYAHGGAAAPLTDVRIRNCTLRGSRGDNIWLEWCTGAVVDGTDIASYLYSGVMVISGRRIMITNNQVRDAPLTAGVVNVYGIAITDLDNTDAARSRDCSVLGNQVTLIDWEGIDTHGGDSLTITGNHVTGCPRGIALVTGNATRLYAPTDCLVSGNTIDAAGARQPLLAGVYLAGIAGKPASATIVGNQLLGYDTPGPVYASYWARADTYIGDNSRPFVPWTPIEMGLDYTPNTSYPPQYLVDGNTVHLRGGVIPRSGGVAARTDIGTLPKPAAWPTILTIAGFAKGSSPGAGNAQVAVTPAGELQMLYGSGTDAYTYWLSGSYQAA
jgi:hypothetical protein